MGRPGGDLLSRVLRRSTIGAEGFHGRVRDGIGCLAPRYGHQVVASENAVFVSEGGSRGFVRYAQRRPRSFCAGMIQPAGAGRACRAGAFERGCEIKPIERLGPVSCTRCRASTPGLSTWWSTTALRRDLVLRGVSRLDAFSGYPVRT